MSPSYSQAQLALPIGFSPKTASDYKCPGATCTLPTLRAAHLCSALSTWTRGTRRVPDDMREAAPESLSRPLGALRMHCICRSRPQLDL
eukprot:15470327-Alexandrium_andersonii.AAC.1